MNLQLTAGRNIDPNFLPGSIAFVKECPASVIPAFTRFATDEQKLHSSWIDALKSRPKTADSELHGFLAAAKESVKRNGNASLTGFLDGIFDIADESKEAHRLPAGCLFQQQSLATLRQFPRCSAAECYDVSDFLLFLLATHPAAFFGAMNADESDATKWLSQLGDLSFAGDRSGGKRRESIRKCFLERISRSKTTEFRHERFTVERTLRQIRFRAWK